MEKDPTADGGDFSSSLPQFVILTRAEIVRVAGGGPPPVVLDRPPPPDPFAADPNQPGGMLGPRVLAPRPDACLPEAT
jgi:hypothetical protein